MRPTRVPKPSRMQDKGTLSLVSQVLLIIKLKRATALPKSQPGIPMEMSNLGIKQNCRSMSMQPSVPSPLSLLLWEDQEQGNRNQRLLRQVFKQEEAISLAILSAPSYKESTRTVRLCPIPKTRFWTGPNVRVT